jgi:hypothetical protein
MENKKEEQQHSFDLPPPPHTHTRDEEAGKPKKIQTIRKMFFAPDIPSLLLLFKISHWRGGFRREWKKKKKKKI